MKALLVAISFIFVGCTSHQQYAANQQAVDQSLSRNELLSKGFDLIERNPSDAITHYFDKVIAMCDQQYQPSINKIYASRGMSEAIYYMALAAAFGVDAVAVDSTCADALYLKGAASIDLGRIFEAKDYLERAVELSPLNALYLSELGHVFQINTEWQRAMEIFLKAEDHAESFSPEELKISELSRAKRGIGYSLIELGDLDAAEAKYLECLALNSADTLATHELKYIKQLQAAKAEE